MSLIISFSLQYKLYFPSRLIKKAHRWLDQMKPWHASIDGGKDEKLPNKPTQRKKLSATSNPGNLETKDHTKGKQHLNHDAW